MNISTKYLIGGGVAIAGIGVIAAIMLRRKEQTITIPVTSQGEPVIPAIPASTSSPVVTSSLLDVLQRTRALSPPMPIKAPMIGPSLLPSRFLFA